MEAVTGMNILPAGIIEMAADDLKKSLKPASLLAQQKELYSATGNSSKDFGDGSLLDPFSARALNIPERDVPVRHRRYAGWFE
jgi:hypothetical protein